MFFFCDICRNFKLFQTTAVITYRSGVLSEPQEVVLYCSHRLRTSLLKKQATHNLVISKKICYKVLYFSCRMIYDLMVSVAQGLFKVDKGNWLAILEKLKEEYTSSHIEFG